MRVLECRRHDKIEKITRLNLILILLNIAFLYQFSNFKLEFLPLGPNFLFLSKKYEGEILINRELLKKNCISNFKHYSIYQTK